VLRLFSPIYYRAWAAQFILSQYYCLYRQGCNQMLAYENKIKFLERPVELPPSRTKLCNRVQRQGLTRASMLPLKVSELS